MGLKLHETKDERKKDECSKAYEETILKFSNWHIHKKFGIDLSTKKVKK
jgi:hypothetical protein